MKKKLLALFMAGIMVMGTAACGKEESAKAESNGTADSGDREKFTVTFIQNEWHGDPNEMEIFKKLEELANVEVEWQIYPSATWEDKKNLILSSGDLPEGADNFCWFLWIDKEKAYAFLMRMPLSILF